MSNFVETVKLGKSGKNIGLPTGIVALDQAINRLQKKTSIGIAAAPKCGKTTLCDYIGVITPYLFMLKEGRLDDINWIYHSYEIDRVSKEFKFAAYFMFYDYGIDGFMYRDKFIGMNQDYLMGKQIFKNPDGTTEQIPLSDEHDAVLKEIYINRIVPMFGEFDAHGRKLRAGKIDFIEESENPTGIWKYLMNYAKAHGEFIFEDYYTTDDSGKKVAKKRIIGYNEANPNLFTVVITDHIRKPKRERGFTLKENIDKLLEYYTILRNICNFTFISICHSNRGVSNVDRLKFAGEEIFPTADDVKDTGNLAEESTILLTMFNPNDEKYNLTKHMGVDLSDPSNSKYRSIHLVESRYTEAPSHIQVKMHGGINFFEPL